MAKQLAQCCCGGTNKHYYDPAFGDCPQGRSAMGSTGATHWSWLVTVTYIAENLFVQFGLTLSLCLFRSCIKAQPWSLPIFITTSVSHSKRTRLLSLSLADSATILRTFIHSLSICSPSPSPLPYSSSL